MAWNLIHHTSGQDYYNQISIIGDVLAQNAFSPTNKNAWRNYVEVSFSIILQILFSAAHTCLDLSSTTVITDNRGRISPKT